jgi:hypothetical protein
MKHACDSRHFCIVCHVSEVTHPFQVCAPRCAEGQERLRAGLLILGGTSRTSQDAGE